MKKAEQMAINAKVEGFMESHEKHLNEWAEHQFYFGNCGRLRNCNAEVAEVGRVWVLKSYRTIIAAIDENGICYDFLRKVYGYTASSAKQINKFCEDFNATARLTWREV